MKSIAEEGIKKKENKPRALVIRPTNECDAECGHCFRSETEGSLSTQSVDSVVEQLDDKATLSMFDIKVGQSSPRIEITGGGDPFCYDDLDYLVHVLAEYEPGILTSGEKITAERLTELREAGFGGKLGLSVDIFHPVEWAALAIREYLKVFENPRYNDIGLHLTKTAFFDEKTREAYKLHEKGGLWLTGLHWMIFGWYKIIIQHELSKSQVTDVQAAKLIDRFSTVAGPSYGDMSQILPIQFIGAARQLPKKLFSWYNLYPKGTDLDPSSFITGDVTLLNGNCPFDYLTIEPNADIKPCCMPGNESPALTIGNVERGIANAIINVNVNPITKALFFERGVFELAEALRMFYVGSDFGPSDRRVKQAFVDRILTSKYTGKCHVCADILRAPKEYQVPEFLQANL
jgi:hypothetical protein